MTANAPPNIGTHRSNGKVPRTRVDARMRELRATRNVGKRTIT